MLHIVRAATGQRYAPEHPGTRGLAASRGQVAVYQRQGTTTPLNKNLKGEEVIASIFHKERDFDEVYFKKKRNRRKE
jgi:hypothetical protein